eukprot:18371-Heterococcus_DN1.PRE.1
MSCSDTSLTLTRTLHCYRKRMHHTYTRTGDNSSSGYYNQNTPGSVNSMNTPGSLSSAGSMAARPPLPPSGLSSKGASGRGRPQAPNPVRTALKSCFLFLLNVCTTSSTCSMQLRYPDSIELHACSARKPVNHCVTAPSTATLCSLSEQCAGLIINVHQFCSSGFLLLVLLTLSALLTAATAMLYYYRTTVRRQCWRRRQCRGAAAMGFRGRIP